MNPVRLLLVGDYFFDFPERQADFELIKSCFCEYDKVVINYEGAVQSDEHLRKAINLKMSDRSLDLPANVILSLCNNHVFDFGDAGLNRVIALISSYSFPFFGLETRQFANDHLIVISSDEIRVCLVGFGWKNEECVISSQERTGVVEFSKVNIDRTFGIIDELECDCVIAYFHAGYEFEYFPLPLHVGLARYLIDRGADLVYGSHSHVVQPFEIYKDRFIFYGLGNFYFGSRRSFYPPVSDYGIAVSVSVASKATSYQVAASDVIYDRDTGNTSLLKSSEFMVNHRYDFGPLEDYSRRYRAIRTRKKNPRPILYYNRAFCNSIKYLAWLSIVRLTGFLKIRHLIKGLLGWI